MEEAAMKHNQQRARSGKKSRGSISLLERIQPDAAGIDCGQNSHFVAVPTDRDPQPAREFRTFTAELHRLPALPPPRRGEARGEGAAWGLSVPALQRRDGPRL